MKRRQRETLQETNYVTVRIPGDLAQEFSDEELVAILVAELERRRRPVPGRCSPPKPQILRHEFTALMNESGAR